MTAPIAHSMIPTVAVQLTARIRETGALLKTQSARPLTPADRQDRPDRTDTTAHRDKNTTKAGLTEPPCAGRRQTRQTEQTLNNTHTPLVKYRCIRTYRLHTPHPRTGGPMPSRHLFRQGKKT